MKNFTNKVAAITGAGSGMGRSLALLLASRGCNVALSDINAAALDEAAQLAKRYQVRVTTHRLDVADKDAVFAWADQVAAEHGKVNLIFNNAGVALGSPIDGGSYRDLEWVMNINFWGVVHGTKAFLPHLKKSGEGHIVNTSSMFGLFAVPSQSGYNASKFAVRGFTEALRQELELQRVNVSATCVHPGVINTGIAHAARMAPELRTLGMKADAISHFNRVPKISSDQAAEIIIRAVQSNKRRVLVGSDARLMDFLVRLMPARYQSLTTFGTRRFQ